MKPTARGPLLALAKKRPILRAADAARPADFTCPVLVCQAADEHFNPGQAVKLAAALGDRATLRSFTGAESAAAHSHIGAFVLMNGVVLDWLAETLDATQVHEVLHEPGDLRVRADMPGAY